MSVVRSIKDFILSYYYPSDQYFLISFPKTGRTWLFYMIDQMKNLSDHPLKSSPYFMFNEHDSSEIIIENGIRNNPLDIYNYKSRYRYRRGKVIFLVRDPRDVIVSHFYQVTKRSKNPFVFDSISEFVRDDILGFKRIIHYYNLWFKNKEIPRDFLLIKYEDLLQNGASELQKVNDFLNLDISVEEIKIIYNNSSAKKMRRKELENQTSVKDRNQLKVRNARIGGYKNELLEKDILFCNQEMKKLNSYFQYKI